MAFEVISGDERDRFRTVREAIIAFCEYLSEDAVLWTPRYPVGSDLQSFTSLRASARRLFGTWSATSSLFLEVPASFAGRSRPALLISTRHALQALH